MTVLLCKMIRALRSSCGNVPLKVKEKNKMKLIFNHNIFINENCNVVKHGIKNLLPLSGGSD